MTDTTNQFSSDFFKKSKLISLLIGGILIFVTGLIFVLLADLKLKTYAVWLFVAIIISAGSGILNLLAENYRDKHVLYIVLKSIGYALSIGFVIFIFIFNASSFCKNNNYKLVNLRDITIVITAILSSISALAQTYNLILNIVTINEE